MHSSLPNWFQNIIQDRKGEAHTSHSLTLWRHPLGIWTLAHSWGFILQMLHPFHAGSESQHEIWFVAE